MQIVISQEAPNQQGVRSHYCMAVHATIGFRVDGLHERADVFCPMCGALAPWDQDRHMYAGLPSPDGYDGRLCEHGKPDITCAALASANEDFAYRLGMTNAVREYPAAALAERYGCAPTVVAWVRYCVECRHAFARARAPVLRHELELLHAALAGESRRAQGDLLSISRDICDLNGACEELSRTIAETDSSEASRPGFVYLIGHSSALKIGWTERHPEKGRLGQLQTASEKSLELLGVVLGTMTDEHQLQRRFAHLRIRGEWFQPAQEILAYFKENHV